MAATTKRHPARTRHRTAIDADGRLMAMDIEFVIDGGAYCTLSPVVLSRGTIHAAGPYYCPNVRVRSKAVATTAPPHGAFRGFGAPQSIFALELQMDRVAAAAGLPRRRVPPAQLHLHRPVERRRTDRCGSRSTCRGSSIARSSCRIPREVRPVRSREPRSCPPRYRLRLLHARRGLHRLRRTAPRVGRQRRGRGRRPHPRACGQHRDRSGNEHDLRADRLRRARHRLRRRGGGAARYGGGARQRADRRVAHVHGGRQARGERSARPEVGALWRRAAA